MSEQTVQQPLPRWKRSLFLSITLALPIAVLGLAEGALRLAGYGGYPEIFRTAGELGEGRELRFVDAGAMKPYFFANPSRPGFADITNFVMPKPEGTVRVMLVGESAAKGYPQPRNLAMSAFLEAMLEDVWKGRDVEVINLGTTAVASFPLVSAVEASLAQDPDLVVLYVGNNEFFGAYGTASINAAGTLPTGALPWMRAVRGLALVQAFDDVFQGGADEDRTLMEQMIGQTVISADSPLRSAAARNIGAHVGTMIEAAREAGVPVLVCTTASNESGLAPIGEEELSALDDAARSTVATKLSEARDALTADPARAAALSAEVLALAPNHAGAHFGLGRARAALGDRAAAREAFLAARDLDTMPWRPVRVTEDAVRRAAEERSTPLCDIAQQFRDASPEGATGWDLLDDHVHLTVRGQAEAARMMVDALSRFEGKIAVDPAAAAALPDWQSYAERLGTNAYDDYRVDHTLRVLFGVPFMKRSNAEAFARFDGACVAFEATMPPAIRETAREWQSATPHGGYLRPLTGMVARTLLRGNDAKEAARYYEIARRQVPDYTSWNLEYTYFLLACRERLTGALTEADRAEAAKAIAEGCFLLEHGESGSGLTERYVGRLHQLRGEWAEAIPYILAARPRMAAEDLVACDQALVMSYVKAGRKDEAIRLVEQGIRESGRFAPIYQRLRAEIGDK